MTLSGSSPAPATHGLYSDLIALAQARRIPVFLDTYGPALDAIWGFWPKAIQLNRREAAAHLRKPDLTRRRSAGLLEDWDRHGVVCGVVTDGPDRSWSCFEASAIERSRRRSRPSTRSARATRSWRAWSTAGSAARARAAHSAMRSAARWPTPWSGTLAPSTRLCGPMGGADRDRADVTRGQRS